MGRLIDVLLRKLTRTGVRRGFSGEHWAWLLIAAAAYVLERARHPDERLERIDVKPGERYLVTAQPRRDRRHATLEPQPGNGRVAAD